MTEELTWGHLVGKKTNAKQVEEFLEKSDIASVMSDFEPIILKSQLFACIEKYFNSANILIRTFQLLQECHLLCPPGITADELLINYEPILKSISTWISNSNVIIESFQFLSMIGENDILQERALKDQTLITLIHKAISQHSKSKLVQRASLQLLEVLIERADDDLKEKITIIIFKPILDNMIANNDDISICYSSFALLVNLAENAAELIIPWYKQIIDISMDTILKHQSPEVTSKCLALMDKLTNGNDESLEVIVCHKEGLEFFLKIFNIVRAKQLAGAITTMELLMRILEDPDLLKHIISHHARAKLETVYLEQFIQLLKERFERYLFTLTELNQDSEGDNIRYIFLIFNQIEDMVKNIINSNMFEDQEIALNSLERNDSDLNLENSSSKSNLSKLMHVDTTPEALREIEKHLSPKDTKILPESSVDEFLSNEKLTNVEDTGKIAMNLLTRINSFSANSDKELVEVKYLEELHETLKASQKQTIHAMNRADTLNKLLRDALTKIDNLVKENKKLTSKINEIKLMSLSSPLSMPQKVAFATPEPNPDIDRFLSPINHITSPDEAQPSESEPLNLEDLSMTKDTIKIQEVAEKPQKFAPSYTEKNNPLQLRRRSLKSNHTSTPKPTSRSTTPDKNGGKAGNAEESKRSMALAGVIEALDHSESIPNPIEGRTGLGTENITSELDNLQNNEIQGDHPQNSLSLPIHSPIQVHSQEIRNLADQIRVLFNQILETQSCKSPGPSNVSSASTQAGLIHVSKLKTIFSQMKLIDGENFHPAEVDIIFSQFRSKHITLFGIAFSIILIGKKRFPDLEKISLVRAISEILTQYLKDSLEKQQEQGVNDFEPLEEESKFNRREFDEMVKVLEKEKKPLSLLFEAYAPWVENDAPADPNASTLVQSVASISIDCNNDSNKSSFRISKIYSDKFQLTYKHPGLSFFDVLKFAREFEITPGLISRNQLGDIFNSVDNDTSLVNENSSFNERMNVFLNFSQFLDLIWLMALRCPLFRGSNPPRVKVCNFLHLMNLSNGRDHLAKRNRNELIVFRPIVELSSEDKEKDSAVGIPYYDSRTKSIIQGKRRKTISQLRNLIVKPST